jgi:exonuclease SbcC
MAAHLAKQLESGKACTVCGSLDHPVPATPPSHIPSNQQIDETKQQLNAEKEKLLTLQQQSEKQQHTLAGIVSVLSELTHSLSAKDINTNTCTKEISDFNQQLKSISLLVKKKQLLQQDQTLLKQSLKGLDAKLTDLRSQLNEHRLQVSSLEGQIQNQLKTIPSQYLDVSNLNQKISLLDQEIVRFDQQFKTASQANQSAQQQLNTALGRLNSTKAQQQQSTDDFNDKKDIINRAIEQSCFVDLAGLKSARLPEQEFLSLTEQWQSHQKDTLKIETQLNELSPQLTSKTQLDSVPLENKYRQAQAKKNELLKQKGQLDERYSVLDNLIKKVAAESDNLKTVTEKYQQTSHLSKIANGSGYQGSKLSFSRFLLGRLLDEILQAASGRLAIMSEGRYQLTRKLDQSNKQSAFGLDIELVDAYTGQKRPVNTFSGGEGFLASLSLALGLSEVVQNNAGGIHLDTLFIDEGFGSLNDEALEQAINVLTALSGNGRLVAVISHVSELKERIDAQLIVKKTTKGSSAEFVA